MRKLESASKGDLNVYATKTAPKEIAEALERLITTTQHGVILNWVSPHIIWTRREVLPELFGLPIETGATPVIRVLTKNIPKGSFSNISIFDSPAYLLSAERKEGKKEKSWIERWLQR